ncbi:G1/S-specific cyclin-D2 [Topomyia yanbarensis]|uniref:G1/S-specific cyclin-D2 n=1 Tax=Topomyia yanbarensis TaxID=2498891 RepID=UPI00273C6E5E|nr:G1/S-specific cyclin-D2 [Topomyia yanbarensis]XP_058821175.1 G1/S-specific cyclin-D2 [Topomyia yanbarensis]
MDLLCTEKLGSENEVGGQQQHHQNVGSSSTSSSAGLQQAQMEVRLNTAVKDPTFLDDRCLENLLKAEDRVKQCPNYVVQKDINASARRIVADWMLDLCDEQNCQEEVSLLSLSYMDRFLSQVTIKKTQLQILAAACLLLASKLREPSYKALPVELLVFYTDYSITKKDLIRWELLVLSWLKWDVSTVTPLDFLELLLCRLPIENRKCHDITTEKVRKHAQAFISLAARECYFSKYTASTVAASSIAASLSGLKWDLRSGQSLSYLVDRFTDLTGVEQEYIYECMDKMEAIFQEQRRRLPQSVHLAAATATIVSQQQPHLQQPCVNLKSSSTTPTDVQDIDF